MKVVLILNVFALICFVFCGAENNAGNKSDAALWVALGFVFVLGTIVFSAVSLV